MWQAKYASAVPINLGLGFDFRPCSESDFLRNPCIVVADRSDLFDAYSHYVKTSGPCMSAKTIKGILCHKEVMLVCVAIKKLIEKRLQILSVHLIHSLSYFLAPNKRQPFSIYPVNYDY